jgi:hypothetical protein
VQTQDASGNPSNPSSAVSVTLSTNNTNSNSPWFFSDSSCQNQIFSGTSGSVTIPTSGNSYSFYYGDGAGTPTITAAATGGVTSTAMQIETIQ